MRLSTREVNVQGRLSKSPTQLDWNALSSSADAWPPLLPSFSRETADASDRFVQGFICKRIEFRCGQLPSTAYTESFLPQWITMAEHRTDVMEDFFAQQGTRLDEETFQRVFGAFERLQSALRDARQERGDVDEHLHDKKITFARPVAHRLIRRSRDRFSLRSVADADDSMESARLSSSTRTVDVGGTLRSSLQRPSLSPIPLDRPVKVPNAAEEEEYTTVLPVEENPDGDHFTGRASGVYYGDVFHSARSSANSIEDDSGPSFTAPAAFVHMEKEEAVAEEQSAVATDSRGSEALRLLVELHRGPTLHSAAWRRCWILFFYYALLPTLAVLYFFGGGLKPTLLSEPK
ncbi:hypothetical protein ABB37_01062 [Leptomonas pyrrhocoris]|uniref:Transmembrane protein n=1 Tax=Leptomonas pyrrhocoris TaxID=157538 RepID=A0A0M9G819_LEPPY|nr:hypothetical protein ABB37_01062 [Leptomonas pyrrhocoris]KPA84517.1 hypothetical protein ABB37_01062 [Leptomonas pyrrhocoris]|eukprot:XP_015662956.1 hypothetical protein ABB37_01062 [Leptomonas pyrrhocoris]